MRNSLSFWWLWLMVLTFLLLFAGAGQGTDVKDYLALTRSLAFDADMHVANEWNVLQQPIYVPPTGFPLFRTNLGTSLFWLPPYLLILLIVKAVSLLTPLSVSGFEQIFVILIQVMDWVYGWLAFYITYRALSLLFPRDIALFATLGVVVAGPALYYVGPMTPSSHPATMLLAALFLYACMQAMLTNNTKWWWGAGIMGGWALLVANTNLGVLALPVVYLLRHFSVRHWLAYGSATLLAFAPQLLFWWQMLGSPFRSPYSGQLDWQHPAILETLFSPFHGLFFFAPFLLVLFLAWVLILAKGSLGSEQPQHAAAVRYLGWGTLLAFAITTVLSAANIAWWGGEAFGARYFLGLTPMLALGLASVVNSVSPSYRRIFSILNIIGALGTVLLYLPYALGIGHLDQVYLLPAFPALYNETVAALIMPQVLMGVVLLLFISFAVAWLLQKRNFMDISQRLRTFPALSGYLGLTIGLPLLLLVGIGVILVRNAQTNATCYAIGCNIAWIQSTLDYTDLSGSYAERAIYWEATGNISAALEDMRRANELLPSNEYQSEIERLEALKSSND